MMSYRFTLEKYHTKSSRHTCPNCNQKGCFVKYIDNEGFVKFSNDIGRCNRESKCGYHVTPKQFFERSPQVDKVTTDKKIVVQQVKSKRIDFIPKITFLSSLKSYEKNNLYLFMKAQFGNPITHEVFEKYQVGTANYYSGGTVYWQIDEFENVRTGKIMLYNSSSGKRIKRPNHITWVHSILYNDYSLQQCFFGEHLLKNNTLPIAIVESEKSALISSCYLPQYLFIASGGKHGCFNAENYEKFIGRKVVLFPDLGAIELWEMKAEQMRELGIEVAVFDFLERNATPEQIFEGYDIADFLLQIKPQTALIQTFIEGNPLLQYLIDNLDLEVDFSSNSNFP